MPAEVSAEGSTIRETARAGQSEADGLLAAAAVMALANIFVVLRMDNFADFQTVLFRVSMLTGWALFGALLIGYLTEIPDTCELIPMPSPFVELCQSFFRT